MFSGFPFLEPSFAAVVRSKGDCVHGVLCKITEKDFIQILKTEGGGGNEGVDGYKPLVRITVLLMPYLFQEVPVKSYDGEEIKAFVLDSTVGARFPNVCCLLFWTHEQDESVPPSKRYLNICVEGAKYHKLDPAYIEKLQSHPVFKGSYFAPLFLIMFSPMIVCIFSMFAITRATGFRPKIFDQFMSVARWMGWKVEGIVKKLGDGPSIVLFSGAIVGTGYYAWQYLRH